MAMLAEPRRKQRWTLNPRGKQWSEDSNKFGQKMLEKMGWTPGSGLGVNQQGVTEHVRVEFKNDTAGIGFSKDKNNEAWTEHHDGFNELLQQLQGSKDSNVVEKNQEKNNEATNKSLELKSKQSRARVHYKKFTRGKDVNLYSSKDIANIFGQKELNEKSDKIDNEKDEGSQVTSENIGSQEINYGVVTIHGGSIADYFKSKMSSIKNSPSKIHKKMPSLQESSGKSEVIKNANNFASENLCLEEYPVQDFEYSDKPKKSKKRKREIAGQTEDMSEISCSVSNNEIKGFVNSALDINNLNDDNSHNNDYEVSRAGLWFTNNDLEVSDKSKKSKKRKRETADFSEISCSNSNKKRKEGFVNRAFDVNHLNDKHSHNNDYEVSRMGLGLMNNDLEVSGKPKKSKKKKKEMTHGNEDLKQSSCVISNHGFANCALDVNHLNNNDTHNNNYEVSRAEFGLANDALDISDEVIKKRVTFNDRVEYSTDSVKSEKFTATLDKFEVENEKRKKKRKREAKELSVSCFDNVALDIDGNEEIQDNQINERKSRSCKQKKGYRPSTLETIEEVVREDEVTEKITDELETSKETYDEINGGTKGKISKTEKKKKNEKSETVNISDVINRTEDIRSGTKLKEESTDEKNEKDEKDRKVKKKKKKLKNENEDGLVKNELISSQEQPEIHSEEVDIETEQIKMKKKKGSQERISEEKEISDKENTSGELQEPPQEKKKRKKARDKKPKQETQTGNVKCVAKQTVVGETMRITEQVETSSPLKVPKIPKQLLKTLFYSNSLRNFPGANLDQIEGYGVNMNPDYQV